MILTLLTINGLCNRQKKGCPKRSFITPLTKWRQTSFRHPDPTSHPTY